MADMIDTAQAKELLGCDDTTLNGYINNGSIRAQRIGGKLMLNRDDVDTLAQDEGTIVITSDSQDLQIDLDEPEQEPIKGAAPAKPAKGDSQVISFGDELDVVSLDDPGTQDLGTKGKKKPAPSAPSDVNTEMLTAVEEDAVTIDDSSEAGDSSATGRNPSASGVASSRRSVRSSRAHTEASADVGALWPALMAATLLITVALTVPTFLVAMAPRGAGAKDIAGNTLRGADDGFVSSLASTFAGFSIEPDLERYKKMHGGPEGFTEMPDGKWRYQDYLGAFKKEPARKLQSLTIVEVPTDEAGVPLKAKSAGGEVYDVRAEKTTTAAGEITQYKVVIDSAAK
jgi:hypothetical protein